MFRRKVKPLEERTEPPKTREEAYQDTLAAMETILSQLDADWRRASTKEGRALIRSGLRLVQWTIKFSKEIKRPFSDAT